MLSVGMHVTNTPASCLAFVAAISRTQPARWERRRALSDRLPLLPRKAFAIAANEGPCSGLQIERQHEQNEPRHGIW